MRQSIKHGRPKAFAGLATAISAAISLANMGLQAANEKKTRRQRAEIENYNNSLVASENLSDNVQQGLDNQIELERQNNVVARCGGRRKLRYGGSSTGVSHNFLPNKNGSASNLFFSDGTEFTTMMDKNGDIFTIPFARKHEDKAKYNHGNIDMLKNGGTKPVVQVETHEPTAITNKKLEVISDSLPYPGNPNKTLADAVIDGDITFREGMNINEKYLNNRNSLKHGKKKALWGWNEEIGKSGLTGGDVYSTGASAFVNIGNGLINHFAYKNMRSPSAPILVGRNSLLTNYNIAPQKANIENARYNSNKYVFDNISSSASATDLRLKNNLNYALATNQLEGEKTNKQTEMINANIRYLDEDKRYRADLINNYIREKVAFDNDKNAMITKNITNTANAFASNINQFADNAEQRLNNKQQQYLTLATAQPETLGYLESLDPYTFSKTFSLGNTMYNNIMRRMINSKLRGNVPVLPRLSNRVPSIDDLNV